MATRNTVGFCLLGLLAMPEAAQAYGTATHAMVVSGEAHNAAGGFSCATSGPQARESGFFNTGIGLPTEGYAYCGLAGGISDQSNLTAASLSSQATSSSFNGGVSTLSADARAGFGSLGVKSTGSFTGSTDAFAYHASEAAAYFSDAIPLPGSGIGTIQLNFTVDGSSFSVGNSQSFNQLNYQINGGPSFNMFSANTSFGTSRVRDLFHEPTPGFTQSGATLSGSAVVSTFNTSVTLGTNLNLLIGLYAASYPGPFTGVANNDFWSTAKLTGILLLDGFGNPITFSVTGASGTIYDNAGAHAPVVGGVAEPASWTMLIAGFGMIGGAMRRRGYVGA